MRIFIVGMPGEGNLGDDLISSLLVQQIIKNWPGSEIGILHGTNPNPFIYRYEDKIKLFFTPRRSNWESYNSRKNAIRNFINTTDLMLIGGGGLFQDSHYLFTVHQWLRYAFQYDQNIYPVWAVGVGFGPLSTAFSKWYLKRVLSRLSLIQVRDKASQNIVAELGFTAQIAPDLVAGTQLSQEILKYESSDRKNVLGCSIRPWKGLEFDKLVSLIALTSIENSLRVVFFIFEHSEPYNISEYDYAIRLSNELKNLGIKSKICCYQKDDIDKFFREFCSAAMGIASRYHANILWQKLNIPVLPISYAPKVQNLYEEAGGNTLLISNIDVDSAKKMFQRIRLDTIYSLPDIQSKQSAKSVSKRMIAFVYLVDIVENIYGVINGIKLRLLRYLPVRS